MAGSGEREKAAEEEEEEEEEEKLLDGVATLDFDMLCSMVAMQTEGKRRILDGDDSGVGGGGESGSGHVFRMWEGELFDCLHDHRRLALETACCPCYRFGKNMERAGLGHCFIQGFVYFSILAAVIFSFIAFTLTSKRCFLYVGFAFALSLSAYLGFFRRQIQTKFNIKENDSSWDGCLSHLLCPCCTLCQESRTLEMNNVRDGIWVGRADSICTKTVFHHLHPPAIISTHV